MSHAVKSRAFCSMRLAARARYIFVFVNHEQSHKKPNIFDSDELFNLVWPNRSRAKFEKKRSFCDGLPKHREEIFSTEFRKNKRHSVDCLTRSLSHSFVSLPRSLSLRVAVITKM